MQGKIDIFSLFAIQVHACSSTITSFILSFLKEGYYFRATCRCVNSNGGLVMYGLTCCVISSFVPVNNYVSCCRRNAIEFATGRQM